MIYTILSAKYVNEEMTAVEMDTVEAGSVIISQIDNPSDWADLMTWALTNTISPYVLPFTLSGLSNYRNEKTAITITYNNGVTSFMVINDPDTRLALSRVTQDLLLDSSITTVAWKTATGYKDMTVGDMQGLTNLCSKREQLCRSAEKTVLDTHEITPYTDMAVAKADFDTALGE